MSGSRNAIGQGAGRAVPGEYAVEQGRDAKRRGTPGSEEAGNSAGAKGEQHAAAERDDEQRENRELAGGGGMRGVGGFDAGDDFPEIGHVSRSFAMTRLPVLLLGMTVAICGPGMALLAGSAFLFLPVCLAVFCVVFRQRGQLRGTSAEPPLYLLPSCLALCGTAVASLLSGNGFGGLLAAAMALGLCAAAAGTWLAVMAARTGKTFRWSLAAVFGLKGRRSRSFAG